LPFFSTIYSETELETYLEKSDLSVEAQTLESSAAIKTLTPNYFGVYKFTPDVDSSYAINLLLVRGKYDRAQGSFYALGYYENMLEDFENFDESTNTHPELIGVMDGGIDGGKAYGVKQVRDVWTNINKTYTFTKYCTTVCFWVYTPSSYTPGNAAWVLYFGKATLMETFTTKPGWNYYEIELTTSIDSCTRVEVQTGHLGYAKFDRIAFK
jgi:hypothetical protein